MDIARTVQTPPTSPPNPGFNFTVQDQTPPTFPPTPRSPAPNPQNITKPHPPCITHSPKMPQPQPNQLAAQQSPDPQTRAEALNTLCDLLAQRITELKLLATTREIEDEGVRDALMVGVGQMERLEGRGEGWWDL
ncbi:MAG: hypothetical protein L6R36_008572 [Xanthoria steineri]|nr:MAG: hypothetical protein L6R36_008572 [Xanthoria steineri]